MLIKDIASFKEFIPINALANFNTLSPYITEVEMRYLIPITGIELFNELDSLTDPNATQKTLIVYLRSALANLTMYAGFDMLNVQFDETGFSRATADKTLYRYQEENLKNMFREKGFDFIDLALEFIYSNIASFEKFKTSAYYTKQQDSFFTSAMQFNAIYNINNSRLVYLKIAAYLDRVIDFEIIPAMGIELFSRMRNEMKKEGEKDEKLMALIPYVRKPLAFLAIKAGITELNYNITDRGLIIEKQTAIGNSHIETNVADMAVIDSIYKTATQLGESYLNMLVKFLTTNRIDYPEYTQEITTTNPYRRDNTNKKTLWL